VLHEEQWHHSSSKEEAWTSTVVDKRRQDMVDRRRQDMRRTDTSSLRMQEQTAMLGMTTISWMAMAQMDRISRVMDSSTPQRRTAMAVVMQDNRTLEDRHLVKLLLSSIASLHNVGTIFRRRSRAMVVA
jgi:hypothetical protein